MNLDELFAARKSIRKYKQLKVEKDLIQQILAAGFEAPSGKNRQNWRFYVVTGSKLQDYLTHSQKSWLGIKDVLKAKLKPSLYEFTERFFYTLGDAPVMIFCYSVNDDTERYHTSIGSVYMALQNMILKAVELGLGTCPMGAPLEIKDEVDRFLEIDKSHLEAGQSLELLCALVLGWSDHSPPKAPRQTDGRVIWFED